MCVGGQDWKEETNVVPAITSDSNCLRVPVSHQPAILPKSSLRAEAGKQILLYMRFCRESFTLDFSKSICLQEKRIGVALEPSDLML